VIEDRSAHWPVDLVGMLLQRNYIQTGRSRHNIVYQLK
jgi:hypothetical protein